MKGNGTGLDSPLWAANWSSLTWATLAIIAVAVALASLAL